MKACLLLYRIALKKLLPSDVTGIDSRDLQSDMLLSLWLPYSVPHLRFFWLRGAEHSKSNWLIQEGNEHLIRLNWRPRVGQDLDSVSVYQLSVRDIGPSLCFRIRTLCIVYINGVSEIRVLPCVSGSGHCVLCISKEYQRYRFFLVFQSSTSAALSPCWLSFWL